MHAFDNIASQCDNVLHSTSTQLIHDNDFAFSSSKESDQNIYIMRL